jgi:hypothetical protein
MHSRCFMTAFSATSLGLVGAVANSQPQQTTSVMFYPVVVSDDPAINNWAMGQYHPASDQSIADLYQWIGGDVFLWDYVFLIGDTAENLSLCWNREDQYRIYLGHENEPLILRKYNPEAPGLLTGLLLRDDQILTNILNKDFTFTGKTIQR